MHIQLKSYMYIYKYKYKYIYIFLDFQNSGSNCTIPRHLVKKYKKDKSLSTESVLH